METRTGKEARLTQEQRELVASHLGLVGVDVRRRVRRSVKPRCDREWDELFQEGCLGLIEAALRFRERRGIPFAAFALPRIHNAVSRALEAGSSPVRLPVRHARRTGTGTGAADVRRGGTAVDPWEEWPDRRRPVCDDPTAETVGQRLRGKYERAVRLAGEQVGRGRSGRRDRGKLIDMLVEERFMVPQEASRRSLRGIARATVSSYARVAQCHQQLVRVVGGLLQADPEFDELVRRIRTDPEGVEHVIDEGLECHLAHRSASELIERLPLLDPVRRTRIVDALMSASGEDLAPWVREVVSRLPADARERVMRVVAASEVEMRADSPKRLRSDPRHGVEVGRTAKNTAVGPDR